MVLQLPPQTLRRHHRSLQRLETRHVGPSKPAFRARLRQISYFAASKSTFSYKFSYEPTWKSTFRPRLLSIFITCHKMPRLPRNLHLVTTSRSADNAIREKHAPRHVWSAAPEWHWRSAKCCACHEKWNVSSENVAKVLRLPHKTTFDASWNMLECHEVPHLPRETQLRDAGNVQKWPRLQNFHRHSLTALTRTVANVSERKRNVRRTPQSETGTLATHSGNRNPRMKFQYETPLGRFQNKA